MRGTDEPPRREHKAPEGGRGVSRQETALRLVITETSSLYGGDVFVFKPLCYCYIKIESKIEEGESFL